jgi:hypothetical protein
MERVTKIDVISSGDIAGAGKGVWLLVQDA